MVSAFWEEAYQKLFDGSTLLVPAMDPHHRYAISASGSGPSVIAWLSLYRILPTRLAYLCLAAMLLGPEVDISTQCLVKSFIDYLSEVDREVLKHALELTKRAKSMFPDVMQEKLLLVLSAFNCRQIPPPDKLAAILADIAMFVFFSKPMLAIINIHSGIPEEHQACPLGSERKRKGVLLSCTLFFLPETACLSAGNLGCKGLRRAERPAVEYEFAWGLY